MKKNEAKEIEQLVIDSLDKLADRMMIPLSVDIWGPEEIAAYLKISRRTASEKVTKLPGFPQSIYLPSAGRGRGHPRWKAVEVIEWVQSHQENRMA